QASFTTGIAQLGGYPMLVDGRLAQIGTRESVSDTARVLGRMTSAIVWRTFAQSSLEEMAAHAGVPVVNALTDDYHPCQILAELRTIAEHTGGFAERGPALSGRSFACVGDGANNMANSYLLGGALAGIDVRIGAPEGYQPRAEIRTRAEEIAAGTGGRVRVMTDPRSAGENADVVIPDTWVSLDTEEEKDERERHLRPSRDRAALPARLPRQGDYRRGDRRARLARVGRGGEPAARPEGGPGVPAGWPMNTGIPATKTARHAVIRDVIATELVRSQADL